MVQIVCNPVIVSGEVLLYLQLGLDTKSANHSALISY